MEAKLGTISTPTSTGLYSVTGLGFQPNFIIFLGTRFTSASPATATNTGCLSVGFANDLGDKYCQLWSGENLQIHFELQSTAAAIKSVNASITTDYEVNTVTMTADGFDLNFNVATGTSRILFYIALSIESSGFTATDYGYDNSVGSFTTAVLNPAIQPHATFQLLAGNLSFSSPSNTFGYGICTGESEQYFQAHAHRPFSTSPMWNLARNQFLHMATLAGVTEGVLDFSAMKSNGAEFEQISYASDGLRNARFRSVGIRDSSETFKSGTISRPSGLYTGTQEITLGFRPKLIHFIAPRWGLGSRGGAGGPHFTDVDYMISIGWCDGELNQFSTAIRGTKNSTSSPAAVNYISNQHHHYAYAQAKVVSISDTGFTIEWLSGESYDHYYLAIGSEGSAGALPLIGVG